MHYVQVSYVTDFIELSKMKSMLVFRKIYIMYLCHVLRAQYGYEYHESPWVRLAPDKGRVPITPYRIKGVTNRYQSSLS